MFAGDQKGAEDLFDAVEIIERYTDALVAIATPKPTEPEAPVRVNRMKNTSLGWMILEMAGEGERTVDSRNIAEEIAAMFTKSLTSDKVIFPLAYMLMTENIERPKGHNFSEWDRYNALVREREEQGRERARRIMAQIADMVSRGVGI